MSKYRYRTTVLTGPWRETPDQALQDAARARQVRSCDEEPSGMAWVVPGWIEEDGGQVRSRSA